MRRLNEKNTEQWSGQKKPVPLLRFIISGIIALAVLTAVMLIPAFEALEIYSKDGAYYLSLCDGEEFSIKYTHSVNRLPVIDTIERTGTALTVRTSLFTTYGAGIPVLSDEVGTSYTETEDGFLLSGIDAEHAEISLITGTYADHRLIYRERELILKEYFGEKALITIKISKVNLLRLFLNGF